MAPRRRVPDYQTRRSTRLRSDAGASTSVGDAGAFTSVGDAGASTSVGDAGASTSVGDAGASTSTSAGPIVAGRVLHLQESHLRGTDDWKPVVHKALMVRIAEVDERLQTLGLIHFVQLGHMPLDHSLLQGLAMFWRPETHTFFFPHVGEMTVSLEDVAFLYGLPTSGRPVTGQTDYDAVQLLRDLASQSKKLHAIKFTKLHKAWSGIGPGTTDPDRIDRYTRALVLELFGCELFPDNTGHSVPGFYLQLLQNIHSDNSVVYNWGGATLAEMDNIFSCGMIFKTRWNCWLMTQPRPSKIITSTPLHQICKKFGAPNMIFISF
ncbi:hypothetical protein LUZ63_015498 [Rhynchospora breviuscula]|uniref:Aminotransferase-like plant mobile domain-containing protein n=1 Tax=Rhynchospora breviuscula TaxID=2022672 RepID=A0A9Q0CCF7_9POAL|nr:hypothetical protein LUZ63_015498 [Rhynchospora breviuscula]